MKMAKLDGRGQSGISSWMTSGFAGRIFAGAVVVLLAWSAGGGMAPSIGSDDCTDDAWEPDNDGMTQAKPIGVAEVQTHRLCDRDWVLFRAGITSAYLVETRNLTGGADTLLTRAMIFSSSYQAEHLEPVASNDNGGESKGSRIYFGLLDGWGIRPDVYFSVTAADGAYGDGRGYDLVVSDVTACVPKSFRYSRVVPVAAHARGIHGERFRTDLRFFNPARGIAESNIGATTVDLTFSPSDSGPEARIGPITVTMPGGKVVAIDDVVASLFGTTGVGAIEVHSTNTETDIPFLSRTYADFGDHGAFGQFVPSKSAYETDLMSVLRLGGLSKSDSVRTNVGFFETAGWPARVEVNLLDAGGRAIGSGEFDVAARGHHQINDVFAALGAPPTAGARAELHVARGCGAIQAYASVLDNRTSDPTYVAASRVDPYPAPAELYVPFAAAGPASADSRWKTTLRISNLDRSIEQPLTVGWFPEGGAGGAPKQAAIVIPPGAIVDFDDAVASLFGETGFGALSITYPPDSTRRAIEVTSRTFVDSGTGTVGELVSAVPLSAAVGVGDGRVTSLLFGGSETRVRAVVFNPTSAPGEVTLRIVSADGERLGWKSNPIAARSLLRVDDLFAELGVPARTDGRVEYEVTGGGARIISGASIVDRRSGDAIFVPSERYGYLERIESGLDNGRFALERIPSSFHSQGSPDGEAGRDADEREHTVTISHDYYLQTSEVTQGLWRAVMGSNPSTGAAIGDSYPVESVSWNDIAGPGGFLERFNAVGFFGNYFCHAWARLPTEAEWEYAARGGAGSRFFFGDASECLDLCTAVCPHDRDLRWCGSEPGGPRRVDEYRSQANAYGLIDVSGNVWEWVSDWYAPYGGGAEIDPTGPPTGEERVVRGGGWTSELRLCRSANRFHFTPDTKRNDLGFRIVIVNPDPNGIARPCWWNEEPAGSTAGE